MSGLPPRPKNRAEELADEMIATAKLLHADTPRKAAEIVAARRLSDKEWDQVKAVWEARWY